jgi:lantibiotic modifying enzyme
MKKHETRHIEKETDVYYCDICNNEIADTDSVVLSGINKNGPRTLYTEYFHETEKETIHFCYKCYPVYQKEIYNIVDKAIANTKKIINKDRK